MVGGRQLRGIRQLKRRCTQVVMNNIHGMRIDQQMAVHSVVASNRDNQHGAQLNHSHFLGYESVIHTDSNRVGELEGKLAVAVRTGILGQHQVSNRHVIHGYHCRRQGGHRLEVIIGHRVIGSTCVGVVHPFHHVRQDVNKGRVARLRNEAALGRLHCRGKARP
jgi:hypothetical protein